MNPYSRLLVKGKTLRNLRMQTMKAVNVSSVNENLLSAGCGSAVTESPFIQPQLKHTRLEFPRPPPALSPSLLSVLFSSELLSNTTYVHTDTLYDCR